MAITELNLESFDNIISNSEKPVLVDFWASWCGPCKMFAPTVHEIANEYSDKVLVCSVDTEVESELSSKYNVMSIPTLILFKGGKEIKRMSGVQSKENVLSILGI